MGAGRGQGGFLIRLLLDTDIGSDVDDELALALLWGSPEVDLAGVSTTYGDVALRAAIVGAMCVLARRVSGTPVAPGHATPWSGRAVWWAGHEGDAYRAALGERTWAALQPPDPATWTQPSPGAAMLSGHCAGAEVLAIGPLTTVAAAVEAGLAGVAGITVMGGDWADASAAEHNIASDVDAARMVFASGLPITAVGVDVTRQVRFGQREIDRFAARGRLGVLLADAMRAWMARWDEEFEVPHDPLTALAILEPDLFAFAPRCAVTIDDDGRTARTSIAGTVRVATAVDVDAARSSMADRIAAGLSVL